MHEVEPRGCERYDAVPAEDNLVVAVCACGWRSGPVLTAGMAGTVWDHHVAQVRTVHEVGGLPSPG